MASIFSEPGVAIATFLHTFGAIGYLAGIAFYMAWTRALRNGHENPSTLATGAALTYVSILANLVGGFIRTYLPGHPSLTKIAEEPWVVNMAVKHLVLFIGIFAAAWLFEVESQRLRRAFREGRLDDVPAKRGHVMAGIVIGSILVAAVLGGASTVIDIGSAQPPMTTPPVTPNAPLEVGPYHFEGTITTDPQGGAESGTFTVPPGARSIEAVLTGSSGLPLDPSQLTLTLRDPTGAATSDTSPQDGNAPRIEMTIDRPLAGTWAFVVRGDVAAATAWALDIEVQQGEMVVEDTVTLAAGSALVIELDMLQGTRFSWNWAASDHVAWEVSDGEPVTSSHRDGDTGQHIAGRDGIHTLTWRADADVELTYRIQGAFFVEDVRTE